MTQLDTILESRQLDFDAVLAQFETALNRAHVPQTGTAVATIVVTGEPEKGPLPHEIEAICQGCDALRLPCLYRQTWTASDGLVKHCPALREKYGGAQ